MEQNARAMVPVESVWNQLNGFYMIPTSITDPPFDGLGADAWILYGEMFSLLRVSFSKGKRWRGKNGRPCVMYSWERAAERLGCGRNKAGKVLQKLIGSGLVEVEKQGANQPNRYYLNIPRPYGPNEVEPAWQEQPWEDYFAV